MEYSEFVNIVKENTQFPINGKLILDAAEKYYGSQHSSNAVLGGPKAEQLSCGCTPMQRTMITFTDDGDYCGGCGKLIPTT